MSPNPDTLRAVVDRIVASESFGRSPTYANLLRYLVESSASGEPPKEVSIAADILGKTDFDSSQSSLVRVYIYKLRKRLDRYYAKEGREDPIRLRIPKGSYAIEYEAREQPSKPGEEEEAADPGVVISLPSRTRTLLAVLGGILIGSLIASLFTRTAAPASPPKTPVPPAVWAQVFDSPRPKLLVIGDLLIYRDTLNQPGVSIRNYDINSPGELEYFRDTTPNGERYERLEYAPVVRNSMVWVQQLTRLFLPLDRDFSIRSMTRFNPKEIGDNDLIVAGLYKTLGIFRTYFPNSPLQLSGNDRLFLRHPDGTTETFSTFGDPYTAHTDYGVIRKVRGPNNNTIILAAGLWDTAASQMVKNLTDPILLAELTEALTKQFGEVPDSFEALYRVEGIDRMELGHELVWLGRPGN